MKRQMGNHQKLTLVFCFAIFLRDFHNNTKSIEKRVIFLNMNFGKINLIRDKFSIIVLNILQEHGKFDENVYPL